MAGPVRGANLPGASASPGNYRCGVEVRPPDGPSIEGSTMHRNPIRCRMSGPTPLPRRWSREAAALIRAMARRFVWRFALIVTDLAALTLAARLVARL